MAFEWNTPAGSLFGSQPSSVVLGTLGTAAGGFHAFRPPKDSPWSKWITLSSPGAVTCFIHSVVNGTTVDIEYDAYVENKDTTTAYTVAGAVAGSNYRLGFDGLALATSNWIPIGFNRI